MPLSTLPIEPSHWRATWAVCVPALRSPVSSITSTPSACGAVAGSPSSSASRLALTASASQGYSDKKNCRRWTAPRLSLHDGLRSGECSQRLVPVARQEESLEVLSEVAALGQRPEQRVELGGVGFEWTRCRWTRTTLGHGETSGLP